MRYSKSEKKEVKLRNCSHAVLQYMLFHKLGMLFDVNFIITHCHPVS